MEPKKFLLLQLRPEDEVSQNEFDSFLEHGGLREEETKRVRVEKAGIPDLNLDDYFAIIVGGSPFDISTPEQEKSVIQKKIEADFDDLFKQVVKGDLPFIGACSGIGLLGKFMGVKISSKYSEPVSGVDINLTEDGKIDPLLVGLPESFRAIVGHKEACNCAPPGAILLASSGTCPVQMFRVGKNVYATQFHPELDAEGIRVRVAAYKHHGYFKPEEADELLSRLVKEKTPIAHEILKRFVNRYRANT